MKVKTHEFGCPKCNSLITVVAINDSTYAEVLELLKNISCPVCGYIPMPPEISFENDFKLQHYDMN